VLLVPLFADAPQPLFAFSFLNKVVHKLLTVLNLDRSGRLRRRLGPMPQKVQVRVNHASVCVVDLAEVQSARDPEFLFAKVVKYRLFVNLIFMGVLVLKTAIPLLESI
jgi:hypothetical protein